MRPDLQPEEIAHICGKLKQNAAKVRYLRSMGLTVRIAHDGSPLVNRAHYEAHSGAPQHHLPAASAQPVWSKAA